MANFRKEAIWHDGIYQLKRTDPVVGGEDGASNKPLKELADRTEYLNQRIDNFNDAITAPDGFRVVGQVESIEELRTIEPTQDQQRILVKSYYEGQNKGGGVFYADFSDSSTVDNGGTIIVTGDGHRWKRIYTNITPEDFGAMGDGVTNDLTALKATSAFNAVVLRNDAVYYIGNATSSDFDPDFIAKGLGKIKWGARELDGYELKKELKSESIYLAPKSWHEATRGNSTISPVYPPYAPPGRGSDIYNKYNTAISWRSELDNADAKVSAVTAFGANIGVRPVDWELTDAYGQDAMMFAQLSERNTALGSETMVWLGAPSKDYLIETNHDWFRNTPPNEWTPENSAVEAALIGTGKEVNDFADYPTQKSETSHNVAIGRDSLVHLVRGSSNVAVGYSAGGESFNGSNNVYVGFNSGRNSVWGQNNTAVGSRALQSGVKLVQFTAIGYGAARAASQGKNSVIAGYLAAQNAPTINNSIIIGAYEAQDEPTLDNKLSIGGVITGDVAQKKVGINIPLSTLPLADLHIRRKNNPGSGRVNPTNGLLVEDSGAADVAVDGGTYANINFYQAGVFRGGLQYGFAGKNIALLVGGGIQWRFNEDGYFYPNSDNTNAIGRSGNRLKEIWVTSPDDDDNSGKVPTCYWVKKLFKKESLLWSGSSTNEVNVTTTSSNGILYILANIRGVDLWLSCPINQCNNTSIGYPEFGGENADKDYSSYVNVMRSNNNVTLTPRVISDRETVIIKKVIQMGG